MRPPRPSRSLSSPFGADFHRELQQLRACEGHPALARCRSIEEAALWQESIQRCSPEARHQHLRWFAKNDLFFLLVYILRRPDMIHPWYFDRCQEVQDAPDNHQDYWSRGAGKSSIISFALIIQNILTDPNLTFCFFSYNAKTAKSFLRIIKEELEGNTLLKQLFPDVFWQEPDIEAPKWSENEGITVKRSRNRKECTIESCGLTDGQLVGKHFDYLLYEDVVTEEAVTSEDMIRKVTTRWEQSLGMAADFSNIRFRVCGTWWHEADTYHVMMERGFGVSRIRPALVTGQGSPLWSDQGVAFLRKTMTPRNFALQILLDLEQAAKDSGFETDWLRYYQPDDCPPLESLHIYIIVDPAGGRRRSQSHTAIGVVGLAADRNIYLLDLVRAHLSLTPRKQALFAFHRKYRPIKTLYEAYAMQADVESIKEDMEREQYRFAITEVGGREGKDARIDLLVNPFHLGKIRLPARGIWVTNPDGTKENLVKTFIDHEYAPYPFGKYKDVLDMLARLFDPALTLLWPRAYGGTGLVSSVGSGVSGVPVGSSWMAG